MIFLKFIDGSGLIYTNVSDAFEHQTYQTSPLNSVILELFEWQSGIQTRHPVTCRDVPLWTSYSRWFPPSLETFVHRQCINCIRNAHCWMPIMFIFLLTSYLEGFSQEITKIKRHDIPSTGTLTLVLFLPRDAL